MSRISEFEPRERDEERAARKRWPGSAWFAFGVMFVLNLILLAFIAKTEFPSVLRYLQSDPSEPAKVVDVPKAAPQAAPPLADEGLKPENAEPPATKTNTGETVVPNPEARTSDDQGGDFETPDSNASTTKSLHTPNGEKSRQLPSAPTRPRPTPKSYSPEAVPQSRFAAPQVPARRAPEVIPAPVVAPVPAPSSASLTESPETVASVRTPAVGVQNNADERQKVTASSAGTAAQKTRPALIPKGGSDKNEATRVASVHLPGMDKGLVVPKMAADSATPKIQIIHRPPEPKIEVQNCGGEVVIPCPTLKKRPRGGSPEGDRW